MDRRAKSIVVGAMVLAWAGTSAALWDAQKCESVKLTVAGKYSYCRMKAEAKAVKTGDPVDYVKCDGYFGTKWYVAETNSGGMCPTSGDQEGVQDQLAADADLMALKLSGTRFVDNSDGTVTDVETGLMWEQKDDLGGIHDKDDTYSWSVSGTEPNGTAFTIFLWTLNNGTTSDGTAVSGCFAGHCDWRIPTVVELQTILLAMYPSCPVPCVDPILGPTQPLPYWSASTDADLSASAWVVNLGTAASGFAGKSNPYYVRAVRGGP